MAGALEEPLLKKPRTYYEGCPGCKVDQVKGTEKGIPFKGLGFIWIIVLACCMLPSSCSFIFITITCIDLTKACSFCSYSLLIYFFFLSELWNWICFCPLFLLQFWNSCLLVVMVVFFFFFWVPSFFFEEN